MTKYYFTKLEGTEIESIKSLLSLMCKENNINQERQNYKILLNKERILVENNNISFTSGSKKYMSFYGKIYLNKNINMSETVNVEGQEIIIGPYENSILIISGGAKNSTSVQEDQDVLYFYIAPSHLLDLQDPTKWENI